MIRITITTSATPDTDSHSTPNARGLRSLGTDPLSSPTLHSFLFTLGSSLFPLYPTQTSPSSRRTTQTKPHSFATMIHINVTEYPLPQVLLSLHLHPNVFALSRIILTLLPNR